ncbi:MAG: hypothetical protein IJ457_09685 [Clostridia bacterium]|nr:hypothetical protein [Clostridia bacterium]
MKKIITVLVLAAMLLVTLGVSASAETYLANGYCQAEFEIKKADPANVKKDGIIGEGEYEKVEVSKDDLAINFISANCYLTADAMADTMEYYFSWDEVNGLNFAVKYDAYPVAAGEALGYTADQIMDGFKTTVEQGTPNENGVPMDNFCFNVGVVFASGWDEDANTQSFYYAVGKKIDGSSYLNGHWGQLGKDGNYEPVGGKDFEISYSGTTVTCEWSIPFAEFDFPGAAAGSSIDFSIAACAGGAEVEDSLESDAGQFFNAGSSWSVSLGQKNFLVQVSGDAQRARATLLDEMIAGPVVDTPTVENTTTTPDAPVTTTTPAPATTPAPTQPATTAIESVEVEVTDGDGNVVTDTDGNAVTEVITTIITEAPTQSAGGNAGGSPVTGDPMIIAAVVAAISACGVVVAKKRK